VATVAKDAAQQLYRSVFAKLTGDNDLTMLLESILPENPKVYQSWVDFESAAALKNDQWITFNIVNDRPHPVEQMQDVRDIVLAVHIWVRGPGSDKAEAIEKRTRELLDDADIATSTLFVWQCFAVSYAKTFEAQPNLWHIESTYRIMCMALEP